MSNTKTNSVIACSLLTTRMHAMLFLSSKTTKTNKQHDIYYFSAFFFENGVSEGLVFEAR
jgi:hypothetical protein